MNRVSQSYVLGIGEGRATFDAHLRNGLTRDEAITGEIANLRAMLNRDFSTEMRELFRGSLDFFLRQQKEI